MRGKKQKPDDSLMESPGFLLCVDSFLLSDTQLFDDRTVTLNVDADQIIQHATTLTYQHLQCSLCCEVLVILLQVLSQVADTEGEQRNLALR